MKKLLTIAIFYVFCLPILAQVKKPNITKSNPTFPIQVVPPKTDVITLSDNSNIVGIKITEVTSKEVIYKKNNQPNIIFKKNIEEIKSITYGQTGEIEYFNKPKKTENKTSITEKPESTNNTLLIITQKDNSFPPPPIPRRKQKSGIAFEEGAFLISGIVDFPSGYTPIGVNVEYAINNAFGISAGLSHASIPVYSYSFDYDNISVWGLDVNASYHLSQAMNTDRFDIIPTLSVGKAFAAGISSDFVVGGQIGLRYFVTDQFGIGTHASFGISQSTNGTLGLSLTYKISKK